MFLSESIQNKWQPVLDHPDLPKIGDSYKRAVTSVVLENQEKTKLMAKTIFLLMKKSLKI